MACFIYLFYEENELSTFFISVKLFHVLMTFQPSVSFIHICYDAIAIMHIVSELVWTFFSKFILVFRNCWCFFLWDLWLDVFSSSKNAGSNILYTIMEPTADGRSINLS